MMEMKAKVAVAAIVVLLLVGTGSAHGGWGYPGWGYGAPVMGPMGMGYAPLPPWIYYGWGYYGNGLSEEQMAELQDRVRELQQKGAPPWEIRAEVLKLLQKFGVAGNQTAPVPGYGYYHCPMMGYGW